MITLSLLSHCMRGQNQHISVVEYFYFWWESWRFLLCPAINTETRQVRLHSKTWELQVCRMFLLLLLPLLISAASPAAADCSGDQDCEAGLYCYKMVCHSPDKIAQLAFNAGKTVLWCCVIWCGVVWYCGVVLWCDLTWLMISRAAVQWSCWVSRGVSDRSGLTSVRSLPEVHPSAGDPTCWPLLCWLWLWPRPGLHRHAERTGVQLLAEGHAGDLPSRWELN